MLRGLRQRDGDLPKAIAEAKSIPQNIGAGETTIGTFPRRTLPGRLFHTACAGHRCSQCSPYVSRTPSFNHCTLIFPTGPGQSYTFTTCFFIFCPAHHICLLMHLVTNVHYTFMCTFNLLTFTHTATDSILSGIMESAGQGHMPPIAGNCSGWILSI